MRFNRILKTIVLCIFISPVWAQTNNEVQLLHLTSSHTSFPDTGRAEGYLYGSVLYTASAHYNDSSVLLIIPKQVKATQQVDLVFWFHGWHNNVDTAAEFYELAKQFMASKRNAILVLAETAKNAPDSYGGKLEQQGMFKGLVTDVLNELKKKSIAPHNAEPGNILLAGHSGAFQVIAYILQNGQMPVQEVFLFDALYSQVDKFMYWINQDQRNHFIHWFTNHGGGTDEMSYTMMQQLKDQHIDYLLTDEMAIKPDIIKNNRILFVHSLREHNVIINNPNDFQLLLENSFILEPASKGSSGLKK